MSKIFYERPNAPKKCPEEKNEVNTVLTEKTIEKKSLKELLANAVIVILSIGLVISIGVFLTEVNYMNYSYEREESSFWYNIENENYSRLVRDRWINVFEDVKETEGLQQCYAVADYFFAASMYKAALETQNTELMEKYEQQMQDAYTYFYDITYIAEDINNKLGLEMNME